MEDKYGRPITSLRISVTENCNLDCFYCHNEGCLEGNREMSTEEIVKLVEYATDFGIEKVKYTGGEPLIRDDMVDIIERTSQFSLKDISLTTNGTELVSKADGLEEAGLDRVNISLDTLDGEKYKKITGSSVLNKVKRGIDSAINAGLTPVKLNTLLLDGINEDEVEDLINFSTERGAILQLIELENVLPENDSVYEKYHTDLDDIEERIQDRTMDVRTRWLMQVRRKYILEGGGEVEIVNPMHNSEFCSHCTRLRITSDGYLKPCLMRNDNLVDVLSPLREGDWSGVQDAYKEAVRRREPYY
ncbi:molybdenum cofactor biosynthesis protein MoeA [candidate division MSBL1 archaeon SCGC-AAA259O05]|uniref:Probable GTP 3',8-cyclase n=2 Tax=candidate division MSBL1 TaxID=215777 RepID=A0A133V2T0_9EURY|nr:molybdenum cofactor biosynthesis protein MoeA [candidate division MSBL1 archaeon SCGC-AAA259E17]KXB00744.1 molybdenum cofactor biosynthesis protein MoeA [candidate division MSBL1 archaeon SCGC-AAA259O05]